MAAIQKLVDQRFHHVDQILKLALNMEAKVKEIQGQASGSERARTRDEAVVASGSFIAAARVATPYLTGEVIEIASLLHGCAHDVTVEILANQQTTDTFTKMLNARRDLVQACKVCVEDTPKLADSIL